MCGLLAIRNFAGPEAQFVTALDMMTHRGPDASATSRCAGWLLGHKRLKVVDLDDRSNQPFLSRDGRFAMIYNGEIYNFRELARKHGLDTHTSGDTEVLLDLYLMHGPQMLNELNGMFAFLIIDTLTGEYFAARDRLGIKPLYISQKSQTLILSSEIAPILSILDTIEFDPIGLRQYAKLRAFFNGRTAYKQIRMLAPGHYVSNGYFKRYWRLPEGPQEPPSDEELCDLIVAAVKRRRLADVPVGSYLSGGLDSSIVAGLAISDHTWVTGFSEYNEFKWAKMAAASFGTNHHEIIFEPKDFLPVAAQMINIRKEPLSVPNEVLLYQMTKEVKTENTVILSGEGADELFFGYHRIFEWAENAKSWDVREFSKRYSYGIHDDVEIVEDALAIFTEKKSDPLNIVANFFQEAHLHGLLRRLDNSTMLCSVEARVPFVDHTLVERVSGTPFSWRMAGGCIKAPLKRIFSELIPSGILEREKVGFPVPLGKLFFDQTDAASGPSRSATNEWLKFNLEQLLGSDFNYDEIFHWH